MNFYNKKWFGQQIWSNIYFVHFPVRKQFLQPLIPAPFQLDTFQQQAWVTLVIFKAHNSRLRYFPKFLSFRPFWQVNVRTYIRNGKKRGVYFFTLFSNDALAVKLGRIPGLPYVYLPLIVKENSDHLFVKNAQCNKDLLISSFSLSLKRQDQLKTSDLHHWLTDVHTIFLQRKNKLIQSNVFHKQWKLYAAKGSISISGSLNPIIDKTYHHPLIMGAAPQKAYLSPLQTIGYIGNYPFYNR